MRLEGPAAGREVRERRTKVCWISVTNCLPNTNQLHFQKRHPRGGAVALLDQQRPVAPLLAEQQRAALAAQVVAAVVAAVGEAAGEAAGAAEASRPSAAPRAGRSSLRTTTTRGWTRQRPTNPRAVMSSWRQSTSPNR